MKKPPAVSGVRALDELRVRDPAAAEGAGVRAGVRARGPETVLLLSVKRRISFVLWIC